MKLGQRGLRVGQSIAPQEWRKLLSAELRKQRSSSVLDQAQKIKALAEAEKANASALKERLETLRTASIAFVVLYGVLALFCYCFFLAKFIPSGVTAGDTLLFTFLALALGAIGLMFAFGGVLIWFPLTVPLPGAKKAPQISVTEVRRAASWYFGFYAFVGLLHAGLTFIATRTIDSLNWTSWTWLSDITTPALIKIQQQINGYFWCFFFLSWILLAIFSGATLWKRGAGKMTCGVMGVGCSLVALIVLELVRIPQGWTIVGGTLIGGEFLAFAMDPSIGQGTERRMRPIGQTLTFAALALLLPVFVVATFHGEYSKVGIASMTFGNFGLYADDAAMEVSASNLQTLIAAADLQGDTLDACRGQDGSAVVTGLKVWWHGIGNRSHVEIPHTNSQSTQGVVVDLDTAQARLIRNHRARCMDLPGTYFESGIGRLTDDGRKELLDAVQRWTRREMDGGQLDQIRIVGHADPMAPTGGSTNRSLSNSRAQAVGQALRESGLIKSFFAQDAATIANKLRIEGDAARQPLKDCPSQLPISERRECNAVNRRVELRLLFGPKPTNPPISETLPR